MSTEPFISSEKMLELQQVIADSFPILDYVVDWGNEAIRFQINIPHDKMPEISSLMRKIRKIGYLAVIRPYYDEYTHQQVQGQYWLLVGRYVNLQKKSPKWNIILFIATLVTVSWSGLIFSTSPLFVEYYGITNPWPTAFLFTFSLMAILGTHELGHMIATWRHGMKPNLPYFIPVPPIIGFANIGTFGALIRQEEPFMDKNVLFDIGISGPLLGLATTILVTIFGYLLSIELPMSVEQFLALHPRAT
ncbi:MAG: site-2 protease family protein, partial [Candidatus Ranarchaeia archaeon]